MDKSKVKSPLIYILLFIQTLIVLIPIFIIFMIPFKKNMEIFKNPFSLPHSLDFSTFVKVWNKTSFLVYYKNSIVVTVISLAAIVIIASMASYVMARRSFAFKTQLYFFFMAGIIIPIRLGVLNIFSIMKLFGLFDNLLSLILIYIAMSIPISIFIIMNFMREIPVSIEESAMIDGCPTFRIYAQIVMPLIKPAIATVIIYNLLPIWNDFYFPLILTKSDFNKTVPLGVAGFFGQHQADWNLIFTVLALASLPPLLAYFIFSKSFIKGIVAGAVKE